MLPRSVHVRALGLSVAFLALVLDFVSKGIVLAFMERGHVLEVVPRFFWLIVTMNRGFSFSLLGHTERTLAGVSAAIWVPVLLGVLAVGMVVYFLRWMGERDLWEHQAGLGLIVGGALGNLLDRVMHGAVVDFLLVNLGPLWPFSGGFFPAFNVADSCISLGVVLLLVDGYLQERQKKGTNDA